MKTGKLTNEQLSELVLSKLPPLSSTTLVGADIGADCAWMNLGDKIMVTSSDPITAGGMKSGVLTIHVSCNDIAACGVRPNGILIVIIAPPSASEDDIKLIVDQASEEASKLGVDIVGGHTEVSGSVNTFVVTSTAFGIIDKDHPVPKGKVTPGDKLILTKTCGIEGSYIAATEHRSKLQGKVDEKLIEEASSYDSLISVVKEGEVAGAIRSSDGLKNSYGFYNGAVSQMHDVTEGGVFGAAYEMACFSKTGIRLFKKNVPMTDATRSICTALDIDPYRLISSGSLLIATSEETRVIEELEKAGVRASLIGEFTDESMGYKLIEEDGSEAELPPPGTDEIYRI